MAIAGIVLVYCQPPDFWLFLAGIEPARISISTLGDFELIMRAESQAVPPKIRIAAPPSLAVFAGVVLGMAIAGVGAVVFFFNPSTQRILSRVPVPQIDGTELSRLRRHALALCAAARKSSARAEGQRTFCLHARDGGGLGSAACLFEVKKSKRDLEHSAEWFYGCFSSCPPCFGVLRNLPGFSFLSP